MRWTEPQFAGIPDAEKLSELSGLVRSNAHEGIYWALNDSDKPADIIAIDKQAKTKATFNLTGIRNIDWEDIASFSLNDRHYLAIADTGDNGGVRTDLFIHVIEEPAQLVEEGHIAQIRSIRFQWPDGARDAESLVADEKRRQFLIISKKRVPAQVFALPFDAKSGDTPALISTLENIAQPDAATMNSKGNYGRYRAQITGADISPDGKWLAVLNYQQVIFFSLSNKKIPRHLKPEHTLTLPWLPQAEGIAFSADGQSLFIGSEQSPSPMIRYDQINN